MQDGFGYTAMGEASMTVLRGDIEQVIPTVLISDSRWIPNGLGH